MKHLLNLVLFLSFALFSITGYSRVILVVPGGGLTGVASLTLANRIDQELHKQGFTFAQLIDQGISVSVGAQIAALLLETNDEGHPKRSTSQAIDLFLASMPGTFPVFTDIAREFMDSYVEKSDIEKVLKTIFDEKVTNFDANIFARLWDGNYSSYASFWTRVPQLLVSVNPKINRALSTEGKLTQENILRDKLKAQFEANTFSSRGFRKLTAIASHAGTPVSLGGENFIFPGAERAQQETLLVDGLIASAGIPLFTEQTLILADGQKIVVSDGANAFNGMSPLKIAVDWSLKESAEDDVIISLGNGGPFDSDYRSTLNFKKGIAHVEKAKGSLTIFALEPTVEHWYMSTLVEEKDLITKLISAAQQVSEDLVQEAALAMIAANIEFTPGAQINFVPARFDIGFPKFHTAIPNAEMERVCKEVVNTVNISPNFVEKTILAVEEAQRATEELLRQARLEDEARILAQETQRLYEEAQRIAAEDAQRIYEETQRRIAEAQRIAEEQAQRIAAQARSTVRSFGKFFK